MRACNVTRSLTIQISHFGPMNTGGYFREAILPMFSTPTNFILNEEMLLKIQID